MGHFPGLWSLPFLYSRADDFWTEEDPTSPDLHVLWRCGDAKGSHWEEAGTDSSPSWPRSLPWVFGDHQASGWRCDARIGELGELGMGQQSHGESWSIMNMGHSGVKMSGYCMVSKSITRPMNFDSSDASGSYKKSHWILTVAVRQWTISRSLRRWGLPLLQKASGREDLKLFEKNHWSLGFSTSGHRWHRCHRSCLDNHCIS